MYTLYWSSYVKRNFRVSYSIFIYGQSVKLQQNPATPRGSKQGMSFGDDEFDVDGVVGAFGSVGVCVVGDNGSGGICGAVCVVV